MQRGQSNCHASSRRYSSQAVRLKKAGAAPGKDGSSMLGQKSTKLPRFGHSRYSAVGPETAALRHFGPSAAGTYVRWGSKARIAAPQHCCPLHLNEQISAAMNRRSRWCRYCCKSPKIPGGDFFERNEANLCSPINMAPRPLAKLSLSRGDEVPHVFIGESHQRARKILISS